MKRRRHLDAEIARAIVERRLRPEDLRRFAPHLREDCGVCDRRLAEAAARSTDALDGLVDETLFEWAERTPPAPVPVPIRRRGHLPWRWLGGGLLVSAVASIAVVFGPAPSGSGRDKGGAPVAPPVELQLLVLRPDAPPSPLGRGALVPAGRTLVFGIRVIAPVCVDVRLEDGGASRSLLDGTECLSVGEHVLSRAGTPLGFRVEGDPRTLRFRVVPAGGTVGDAFPIEVVR